MTQQKEQEYQVERILDRKRIDAVIYYLVHWKGQSQSDASWEPIHHLVKCEAVIRQFETKHRIKTQKEKKKIEFTRKIFQQIQQRQKFQASQNSQADRENQRQRTRETKKKNLTRIPSEKPNAKMQKKSTKINKQKQNQTDSQPNQNNDVNTWLVSSSSKSVSNSDQKSQIVTKQMPKLTSQKKDLEAKIGKKNNLTENQGENQTQQSISQTNQLMNLTQKTPQLKLALPTYLQYHYFQPKRAATKQQIENLSKLIEIQKQMAQSSKQIKEKLQSFILLIKRRKEPEFRINIVLEIQKAVNRFSFHRALDINNELKKYKPTEQIDNKSIEPEEISGSSVKAPKKRGMNI